MNHNPLIFGKIPVDRIVSCEIENDITELFIEDIDGSIRSEFKQNRYWILAPVKLDDQFVKMQGDLYYKFAKWYTDRDEFLEDRKRYYKRDIYSIHDDKEAAMVMYGFTYYKGMKINDVSVLSFDIESTSLEHTHDAKVLLISNTFRKNGIVIRKMFSYDDFETEAQMFDAWSDWVREINPSIIMGHNIYMYDLPYMAFCASKAGTDLRLGRNGSNIRFNEYESKFRKDGSQFYNYKKAYIYGREIVDTMFLAYKYDIGRKYENYRLKSIIKAEGLEVKDRQFYDADQIRYKYTDKEEWTKIKKYAEHDADDALALYDLMVPAYFYLTQSIPKSFQQMIYSASGSQINAFLVRSYLQDFHSIPKATEGNIFEGAISIGNPAVYQNVFKIDVASLYPSIMLEYEVHDKRKDIKSNFVKMVDYFTNERLENKKKGRETDDRYFKDLEQAQKIVINSAYGMLGAPGLNFNSPFNAAFITRKGREVLQKAIDWAHENGYALVNADTDSIAICNQDLSPISIATRSEILHQVNSLFPERIHFEDDGYYSSVVVIKAKNYVLQTEDGKIKTKGSALKATMKEKALKEFIDRLIKLLLANQKNEIINLFHEYVKEIYNIKDISRWCSKKTITNAVLNPERTNEQRVLDAIEGEELQEGDKIFVYFKKDGNLQLQDKWDNDHDPEKLLKKLYNTLEIFDTVLDMKQFIKFHLKSHKIKCELHTLLGLPEPEKVKRTRKVKDALPEAKSA